ncbi:MAG: toxin-antitoxin system, antitoxin component domain protein [Actinomyces bowdenii]|nr:toxin-antitoxin system, antitoxin component domain protein [Actinomyces bowdenii]
MERTELEPRLAVLTREERLAIRTTRTIVAHAGYRSMNDDVFRLAITRRIPEMLARIRAGAGFDSTDGEAPGLDGYR